MKSKLVLFAASALLCLGLFAACGSGINDAKSLVEANKEAQSAVSSFHMDADIDMDMTISVEGMEAVTGSSDMDMPIKSQISLDCGKETAHGTNTVDMAVMGQAGKMDSEIYCDFENGMVYTKAQGLTGWVKSEQASSMTDAMNALKDMDESILEKAEFESDDDEYILTIKAEDLGDALDALGTISEMGTSGMEINTMEFTGGTIEYTFDKETTLLESIEMEDVAVDAKATMQGSNVGVGMVIDTEYEFSKYNELEKADYEIPDEVINGTATSTTQETQAATEAQQGSSLPPAETQLTVTGNSTPNGQGWYVVGQDSIPAGTYNIFHGAGQGVLTLQDSGGNKSLGTWTIGYSHKDELTDGTTVTLKDGDLVFITKELELVFDPVH